MQEQNEIEGLYRKYYADVYRYLLSMCRNTHTAEDLSQNTFLKVISGIRGFRGSCPIKTWIFAIARHEYYHWLRANPVSYTHLDVYKRQISYRTAGICSFGFS